MFKKFIETAVLLSIAIILPLCKKLDLLSHWTMITVMVYGAILSMTQPGMPSNNDKTDKHDKYSMYLILIGGISCFVIPIMDYAYGRERTILTSHFSTWLGILMMFGGVLFRWWSIHILGKFFTAKVQILNDHQLIQEGPYQILRHPSYLGAWVSMMGISVFLQSIPGLVFSVVVYCFINGYRIECEEKALLEKFPDAYRKYQEKTWRMIPYIF